MPEPGDEPVRFDVTVTFEEHDGKTHLTMQMLFPSKAARDHVVKTYGAEEGAKQTLGRLAALLWSDEGRKRDGAKLSRPGAAYHHDSCPSCHRAFVIVIAIVRVRLNA